MFGLYHTMSEALFFFIGGCFLDENGEYGKRCAKFFGIFSRITHILILCFCQVYYTKTLAPEAELNIASFIKEQKYGVTLWKSTNSKYA